MLSGLHLSFHDGLELLTLPCPISFDDASPEAARTIFKITNNVRRKRDGREME